MGPEGRALSSLILRLHRKEVEKPPELFGKYLGCLSMLLGAKGDYIK